MTLLEIRNRQSIIQQTITKSKICYLTVVIPAKNEEQRLPGTLQLLAHELRLIGIDYEIIVVSDGSHDRTASVARTLGARVISNPKSLGIAAAFRMGAGQANGEVVMLCPADIENFGFLKVALSVSRAYDVVSISKRHPQSDVIGYNGWRWFVSNNYHRIITLLFGGLKETSDTHYIKIYNSEMLKRFLNRCVISGPVGETELLLRARTVGCTFYEVPAIIKHNRQHSKTSPKLIVKTVTELLRLRLQNL